MLKSTAIKGKEGAHRTNLVFVRAGDQSKHRNWFPLPENRNWDLCISAYQSILQQDVEHADFVFRGGLSKWTDFAEQYFSSHALLAGYEYICVIDDDVSFSHLSDIDNLFSISTQLKLSVSQASLSQNSFASWRITRNHPGSLFRYTNFVECMAPVFSKEALEKLQAYICTSVSGQGLDLIFWDALGKRKNSMAILDVIEMQHEKPIDQANGEFYKHLRSNGINVADEVKKYMQLFNFERFELKTLEFVNRIEKIEQPGINQ